MSEPVSCFDPHRGRTKAEDGGAGNPAWANKPTKTWDDDASYTRPPACPDPYNSPNERGKSSKRESGY